MHGLTTSYINYLTKTFKKWSIDTVILPWKSSPTDYLGSLWSKPLVRKNILVNLSSKASNEGTVLVLKADGPTWLPAWLVNSEGQKNELSCFDRDHHTDGHKACSINWKNQLHVFGGHTEKRQISRLNGYRLERIGTLPFDHSLGGCSVMANQFIFLCFHWSSDSQYKRCRRSTGPLDVFSEIPLANHNHHKTQPSCSESKSFCLINH